MPYYMLQATYSPQAWSGMVKSPQNRLDAVRPVVEKLGGKIEGGLVLPRFDGHLG
jgi:uncharacterized protein with GYD domain